MIVDDRLDTVLRTQPGGTAGYQTQLRQLVDILGRTSDHDWGDTQARGIAQVALLHNKLGDARSAVLIGSGALRSARLITELVTLGPRTAQAVIARAQLSDDEWAGLAPMLPIQARGVLRHRRDLGPAAKAMLHRLGVDDFALAGPPPVAEIAQAPVTLAQRESVVTNLPVPPARPPEAANTQGIGAIVRRIEEFRRHRDDEHRERANRQQEHQAGGPPGQSRLPFADEPGGDVRPIQIDIAINAAGVITAADGVDAAMLVGHAPFAAPVTPAATGADPATRDAHAARLPILGGRLQLSGAAAIAGAWRIDAVPLFGPGGGQYQGYRARLRRAPSQARAGGAIAGLPDTHSHGDTLQQLLHELRTPINAIQGFAELIQQQMLGPTPHQYRSLAASIAADAARMLAGFEDVERLILLESGRTTLDHGTSDLGAVVAQLVAQLEPVTAQREIRLRFNPPPHSVMVLLPRHEAERTMWRLLSTLIGAAAPGERLTLALNGGADGAQAQLSMTLPAALALRDDDALFAPDLARGTMPGAAMLGQGFALNLCAAEIRAAGGTLVKTGSAQSPGCPVLDMILPIAASAELDRSAGAL